MAMADLARIKVKQPTNLTDISLRQGISISFLEQIFLKLKKNNLVQSSRGPSGGYLLTRSPEDIKLLSIIRAVDEKVKTVGCKKESKKGCTGKSIKCITHDLWDDLETHINNFFEKNTLKDIIYRANISKQKELN
jgi:Rrf2 family iron-sulfur cluster assembly transcriptional regulator